MMLYLLDANTLINTSRTWFSMNRVPEFWTWILHHAAKGTIKMPPEIYSEVEAGKDALAAWVKVPEHKKVLRLAEPTDIMKVQTVLSFYGNSLNEADLIKIGQDPFLVAAALGHPDRRIVTAEVSSPKKIKGNRKVPDICNDAGVTWRNPIQLLNELDFSTSWDSP